MVAGVGEAIWGGGRKYQKLMHHKVLTGQNSKTKKVNDNNDGEKEWGKGN